MCSSDLDFVGDEPSDITFLGPMFVAITLNSKSGASVRRTHDMSVITPIHPLIFDDPTGFRFAVKQPRMIETLPDGRVFVLNFMGGHKGAPSQVYDLDLYMYDPTAGDAYPYRIVGDMGTTNSLGSLSVIGLYRFSNSDLTDPGFRG